MRIEKARIALLVFSFCCSVWISSYHSLPTAIIAYAFSIYNMQFCWIVPLFWDESCQIQAVPWIPLTNHNLPCFPLYRDFPENYYRNCMAQELLSDYWYLVNCSCAIPPVGYGIFIMKKALQFVKHISYRSIFPVSVQLNHIHIFRQNPNTLKLKSTPLPLLYG